MAATERLPKLIAFDLDYTLWDLWIDTHVTGPLHRNKNNINEVLDKNNEKIKFYRDVPGILLWLRDADVTIAACSRTDTPKLARQALDLLLIAPKAGSGDPIPAVNFFDELEIYPGSKLTHFKKIHQRTGIPYSEMLFFDDEHRNSEVEQLGVTFSLVRRGVTNSDVQKGITRWRNRNEEQPDEIVQ